MRKSLQGLESLIQNRRYPNLPNDLQPYYVYLSDCGHSVMGIAQSLLDSAQFNVSDLWELEAAIPVKYVITHTYTIYHGHLLVDVPYSMDFGIVIDDSYSEF